MFLDNIIPSNDLSAYIRKYRIVDFVFSKEQAIPFKAYPPHPQECLQFFPKDTETVTNLGGTTHHNGQMSVITGQYTAVTNRYVGRNFLTIQVVFQPGALYRITGIPAFELANQYFDATLLLGNDVNLVNEQLFYASSYKEMIQIVEHFLRELTRKSCRETQALDSIGDMMLSMEENKSLEWFAKEACLSYRQFDRKFKERMGVNPKLFYRIIRFNAAYRMKNKYPDKDWLTVALHSGYYDYQHLVRDYKEFTGLMPSEFFAIESRAPERYFGDAEV